MTLEQKHGTYASNAWAGEHIIISPIWNVDLSITTDDFGAVSHSASEVGEKPTIRIDSGVGGASS
jgi:hypothetical protein